MEFGVARTLTHHLRQATIVSGTTIQNSGKLVISRLTTSHYPPLCHFTKGVPFHQRRKGPSNRRLASLQTSNKRYQQLMSYRYYRLQKKAHTGDHARMTQLHSLLKNLDLSFRERKFSGQDPILIFDFLTRMVEECDTSVSYTHLTLPTILLV